MSAKNEIIIKRYPNRKLYDTAASRYVTLEDIAQMVKRGDEVKILDNKTKKDLTALTLAQILYEQEKQNRSILPLSSLKSILRSGGEQIGNLADMVTGAAGGLGKGLEDIQARLDTRIEKLKEGVASAREMKKLLSDLEKRLDTVEKRVKKLE